MNDIRVSELVEELNKHISVKKECGLNHAVFNFTDANDKELLSLVKKSIENENMSVNVRNGLLIINWRNV